MALMDKLKAALQRSAVPDETRNAVSHAKTPADLLKALEKLRGQNEMEMRDLEEEQINAEHALVAEEGRVRKGGMTPSEKLAVLRRIERLRKHVDNQGGRIAVLNDNINLHLNLIARIHDLEVREMRGVGEDTIDELVERVREGVDAHERVRVAGREVDESVSSAERREEEHRLADLERSILGEEAPSEPDEPSPKKKLDTE